MRKLPFVAALFALGACTASYVPITDQTYTAGKGEPPAPEYRKVLTPFWQSRSECVVKPTDGCERERPGVKHIPPAVPPHEPPHEPPHDPPTARDKGNNGWGDGSQDAPGNSGPHNNAENGPQGKDDGRGKSSGNSGGNRNARH